METNPLQFDEISIETVSMLMAQKKMKRFAMAKNIGVHKTTLRRWVTGKIKKIKRENVVKLASLLGVERLQVLAQQREAS